jgi:hypothetical protein
LVTVSEEARELIERRRNEAVERNWYLVIHWRKGEMENRRGPDGDAVFERLPDPGWAVELVGYPDEPRTKDLGEPLLPNVRLIIEPRATGPFVSGAVVVEDGALQVRAKAV